MQIHTHVPPQRIIMKKITNCADTDIHTLTHSHTHTHTSKISIECKMAAAHE
jgi:hypothetical protein